MRGNQMSAIDVTWVRRQFPALAQEADGRPVVFFDGPGGTQVPRRVIDAMVDYLVTSNANTHGEFATSARTDEMIASARASVADLLGCDSDEVVFGANMTSITFAMSRAIGRELKEGDEIVVTLLDHDANYAPWQALAERGVVVRAVGVNVADCTLDMDDLRRKIGPRTRVVAVGYASNAVGTINDVAEVCRLAHGAGATCYVDAVHYAPHGPIDVRALDCDFLVCSPYKFFGPHVGALYGKREHLARLRPYKVRPAADEAPDCWETGTQNHEGIAGIAAAIDYLAELGARSAGPGRPPASRREALVLAMSAIREYESRLAARLIRGLLAIPGLTFYGITDAKRAQWRTPTVSVRLAGHSPRELSRSLAGQGIFAWEGNYYAINLTDLLGVEDTGGMFRIGLVHYNTAEEVDRLLAALGKIASS
jgi:cysteine desulfurase family protein (TIGR01976 family)